MQFSYLSHLPSFVSLFFLLAIQLEPQNNIQEVIINQPLHCCHPWLKSRKIQRYKVERPDRNLKQVFKLKLLPLDSPDPDSEIVVHLKKLPRVLRRLVQSGRIVIDAKTFRQILQNTSNCILVQCTVYIFCIVHISHYPMHNVQF